MSRTTPPNCIMQVIPWDANPRRREIEHGPQAAASGADGGRLLFALR